MATTKELIDALIKTDPTGEKEVIVAANDGWGYSITQHIREADVNEGVIDYDSETPNCIIIDAEA